MHGHYTRAEIEAAHCYAEACGYGVLSIESPWIHREGVLAHQASATDLLFITLRKSEALFSPSTRYRDLALGPSLFHWESQSTTTASSPTGQRYIHHETRGSRVLLFVRERPMAWGNLCGGWSGRSRRRGCQAVAWHSGGVGGLRASVIGRPAHSCCRTELSRIFSASLSPLAI